jgi:protein phosphatase
VNLSIPELSLVVLIGPSGSGKSTFARRHFKPTEILSSDVYRGLVGDDENDQTVTEDAFDALYYVGRKRLAAGRLTVLDATNVQPHARAKALALAREFQRLVIAVVFDLPESELLLRNRDRGDRDMTPHVVRDQVQQMRRGIAHLEREGFRRVYRLGSVDDVDAATVVREPLWSDPASRTEP